MQTQIQKWGNSLGIRIPKDVASRLHIKNGAIVNLEVLDNYLVITPKTSGLELLLSNITDTNRHNEAWNKDDLMGNEVW